MDLQLTYSYQACVDISEKVSWKLDDVFPEGTPLDFTRPFLPESLAPTKSLDFLDADARRKLNQITGNAYLNLFAFVEEFILATVVEHASAEMFGDHVALRALVRFADEELKHQELFARYRRSFDKGFTAPCEVLSSASEVAGAILGKHRIAVLLITLHIEWMTQQHYTESARDDGGVDPLFTRLLKQHWLEEAQHARIDALELQRLVADADADAINAGFAEYEQLLDAMHGLLTQQSKMDVASLAAKLGRTFSAAEQERIAAEQLRGYVGTFLVTGMTNPTFVTIIGRLDAPGAASVAAKATAWS